MTDDGKKTQPPPKDTSLERAFPPRKTKSAIDLLCDDEMQMANLYRHITEMRDKGYNTPFSGNDDQPLDAIRHIIQNSNVFPQASFPNAFGYNVAHAKINKIVQGTLEAIADNGDIDDKDKMAGFLKKHLSAFEKKTHTTTIVSESREANFSPSGRVYSSSVSEPQRVEAMRESPKIGKE